MLRKHPWKPVKNEKHLSSLASLAEQACTEWMLQHRSVQPSNADRRVHRYRVLAQPDPCPSQRAVEPSIAQPGLSLPQRATGPSMAQLGLSSLSRAAGPSMAQPGTGLTFVYGTLMAEEVLQKLLRRLPAHEPATLHGYARFRVKGVVYPAITPTPGASVEGMVLTDLTQQEGATLDNYEAHEYFRQTVEPTLQDGRTVVADVYVWKPQYRDLLIMEPWDYQQWRANNLHLWVHEVQNDTATSAATRPMATPAQE